MNFFTAEAMRNLDARTIHAGTPGVVLMGRAARAAALEFLDLCGGNPGRVLICCGAGNNGGDGFALAFLLHAHLPEIEVWVAAPRDRIRGDALHYLQQLEQTRTPVSFLDEESDWELDPAEFPMVDWVVDCLLGTGSRGVPRGPLAGAVRLIQTLADEARVLAMDLPSGLNADSGEPFDPSLCVRADFTLTLGAPKTGFLHEASADWTGSVTVMDLGFAPEDLAPGSASDIQTLTRTRARTLAPFRRPARSHKGMFGHVLVIGGSPGMAGAPVLTGLAALRRGAGLVSLLLPRSCAPVAAAGTPELMVHGGWDDEEGCLRDQELDLSRYDAVVIGPGLRVTGNTRELVDRLCLRCPVPLLLDADALRCLAGRTGFLRDAPAPRLLTPHPGEMAALLGIPTAAVQNDRFGAAANIATLSQATVILKGSHSCIQSPDGSRWLNLNGNPALATAGSGDVLAGILAAHLAQGNIAPQEAAALACFEHGRAADRAAIRKGFTGMTPRDLVEALPGLAPFVQS